MSIYIMSRKFKKLNLQYEYLLLEKEEVFEVCRSSEPEIREFLKEHYPDHYETFYGAASSSEESKKEESLNISAPEEIEEVKNTKDITEMEDIESSTPKNPDLKKLFRKIVEKTHPDKAGDHRYADLFSDAVKAYDSDDIGRLLGIAGEINIELTNLSVESLLLLNSNIQKLFKEIQTKKNTIAWAWSNTVSEEDKKKIIENILLYKGVQP